MQISWTALFKMLTYLFPADVFEVSYQQLGKDLIWLVEITSGPNKGRLNYYFKTSEADIITDSWFQQMEILQESIKDKNARSEGLIEDWTDNLMSSLGNLT